MFLRKCFVAAAGFAAIGLIGSTAYGHITLETPSAPAGSSYKAVFRVPHGCEGTATVRLRVRLPDGVVNVKPQPKPGWDVSTVMEKLAKPIILDHGREMTETVREVDWAGGKLPDSFYDEFVVRVELPDKPDATLYFPVVQECEKGVNRWIEIPEPGKTSRDYKEPAPQLKLLPKNK